MPFLQKMLKIRFASEIYRVGAKSNSYCLVFSQGEKKRLNSKPNSESKVHLYCNYEVDISLCEF